MIYILKYWKEILATLLALFIYYQDARIKYLTKEIDMKEQSEEILVNEYVSKMKHYNEEKIIVKKEYITKEKKIYEWKESNVTCEDAIKYIDDYIY